VCYSRSQTLTVCRCSKAGSCSRYADVADSVEEALKLDKQIQTYQSRVANKQTSSLRERTEDWSQVLRARTRRSFDEWQEQPPTASTDGLKVIEISESELLDGVGGEPDRSTMNMQTHYQGSEVSALPEAWVGDTLLLVLGSSPYHKAGLDHGRDRTPPADRQLEGRFNMHICRDPDRMA
jgi:hypothetical protein